MNAVVDRIAPALNSDTAQDEDEIAHLMIKGQSSAITFRLVGGGGPFLNALEDHVRDHGFKGWRSHGNFILNMEELQAFWVTPLDDKER